MVVRFVSVATTGLSVGGPNAGSGRFVFSGAMCFLRLPDKSGRHVAIDGSLSLFWMGLIIGLVGGLTLPVIFWLRRRLSKGLATPITDRDATDESETENVGDRVSGCFAGRHILIATADDLTTETLAGSFNSLGAEVTLCQHSKAMQEQVLGSVFNRRASDPTHLFDLVVIVPPLPGPGLDEVLLSFYRKGLRVPVMVLLQPGVTAALPEGNWPHLLVLEEDISRDVDGLSRVAQELIDGCEGCDPVPGPYERTLLEPLLSRFADEQAMVEVTDAFVEELESRVQSIRRAAMKQDMDALENIVHHLRDAAGSYGFNVITDAAGQVESQVSAGAELERVKASTERLLSLCRRAMAGRVTPLESRQKSQPCRD